MVLSPVVLEVVASVVLAESESVPALVPSLVPSVVPCDVPSVVPCEVLLEEVSVSLSVPPLTMMQPLSMVRVEAKVKSER